MSDLTVTVPDGLPFITSWIQVITLAAAVLSVVAAAMIAALLYKSRRMIRAKFVKADATLARMEESSRMTAAAAHEAQALLQEAYAILAVAKGHQALAGKQRDDTLEALGTIKATAAEVKATAAVVKEQVAGTLTPLYGTPAVNHTTDDPPWDGVTERRSPAPPEPDPRTAPTEVVTVTFVPDEPVSSEPR